MIDVKVDSKEGIERLLRWARMSNAILSGEQERVARASAFVARTRPAPICHGSGGQAGLIVGLLLAALAFV